jgi:hypothetical protein
MKHCIKHLCSAHFDQSRALIITLSRDLNIQGVSEMLGQTSTVSPSHQTKKTVHINIYNRNECV